MSHAGLEKHAFKMLLNSGMKDEYKRRHDAIWPELVDLLHAAGVCDHRDRRSREPVLREQPRGAAENAETLLVVVVRPRASHVTSIGSGRG